MYVGKLLANSTRQSSLYLSRRGHTSLAEINLVHERNIGSDKRPDATVSAWGHLLIT